MSIKRLSLLLLLFSVACQSAQPPPAPAEALERPNIIMIVVDDLRWDEMGVAGHPYLETPHIDRLAAEGAYFSKAFHTVPLCSPNRATILTGQYPSRHGIIDNVSRARASHRLETFPRAIQRHGYETAFLGKWHMGNDPTPRPGFDLWVAIPGQGRSINPELYENGQIGVVEGYLTDILTERALSFIDQEREGPFMLYLAHKAIHPDIQQLDDGSADPSTSLGYIPAPRHRGRYADKEFPLRPNAVGSLDELTGKPALRRALQRKYAESNEPLQADQKTIRDRAEMLLAADEGLGRLMSRLEESGKLANTAIILTSDNGFFYGEHALTVERRLPYEESIRTPLLIRYPPLIAAGTRIDSLVASVDLAPTALDLAGTPIGEHIQGRSLLPLLRGNSQGWRDSILIEFYTYENPFPWLLDMDYRALRTGRYKYIHWMQHPDENELYDLLEDPYEVRNLFADPAMEAVKQELQKKLRSAVLHASGLEE
ncbi:MAG TPA: sulfatase [Acidobacteriota bacterium]|nr:sulfatase [Acidobacteriota bacterium]